MIGLAISMGASGLLIPRHDGRAVAAEPQSAEAEAAPVPAESSSALSAPSGLSDEVIRPETWRSAPARGMAEAPGSLRPHGTPADDLDKVQGFPSDDSFEQLRLERDSSLERLRRQRSQLQNSLSDLRVVPESVEGPETVAPKAIAPDTTPDLVPPEVSGTILYRVKPGDTLATIAQAHGVSSQTLIALNDLQNPHFLRVHQLLRVPQPEPDVQATHNGESMSAGQLELVASTPQVVSSTPVAPASSAPRLTVHRVAAGETIAAIARAYGVSQSSLIAENKLTNPNFIRVGQELQIPSSVVEREASLPLAVARAVEAQSSSPEPFTKTAAVEAPSLDVATVPPGVLDATIRPEPIVTSSSAIFSTEFIAVESDATAEAPEVVPPVEALSVSEEPAVGGRNLYASQLIGEVSDLQGRYSSERVEVPSVAQQPTLIAANPIEVVSGDGEVSPVRVAAVAPSDLPSRSDAVLSVEELQERAMEPKTDAFAERAAEIPAEPSVVAAAPLGSESYAPLLEPIVGRMVSPELPPLPAADAFLPEGSNLFAGYAWPARGVLTSGYGPRWGRMHRGIDIAAPVGTPIYAAAPGVIEFAGWNSGGYGYMVDIRHPDGSMTRYAHNSRLLVQRGQEVAQGEQISEMGSTGYSTGPHLHFEIHLPSRGAVNPMTLLASR